MFFVCINLWCETKLKSWVRNTTIAQTCEAWVNIFEEEFCILNSKHSFLKHWRGAPESSTTLYHLNAEPNPPALYWMCILLQWNCNSTKATFQNIRAAASANICTDLWKQRGVWEAFTRTLLPRIAPTLKHASDSVCYFHKAGALRASLYLISQRGGKHAGLFHIPVVLTRSAETEQL